jgi:2-C-methyl-D-erythritol 4-phosphate cytidylyltransferase
MRNIAIILAGGTGVRLGYNEPKQFLKVAGKLIIEHTIQVFQRHPKIDEIAIVCHQQYLDKVEKIINKNGFNKVKKVLNGGEQRNDSSLSAINAYSNEQNINLIFHDAVRPLISERIICSCIDALKKHNAVDVAVQATDTIIEAEGNFISTIPDRNKLRKGQTPQAFKLETIKKAYEAALNDKDFKSTDDCGVVKKYLPSEKIFVVKGEEINMKLTYEEDLFLIDKLFQLKTISLNNKQDLTKLKNKVLVIFGGSYGIGKEIADIASQNMCKVYAFSRSKTSTDISKKEDVKRALESIYKKEGKIDFIINTAAVLHKGPLAHMDYSTILESIQINYIGSVIIAKEAFSYLKKSKGSLLFFTSSSYTRGRTFYSLYSSSKSAIVNFTQGIASEWDSFNIKVNCMNPERTLTPMRVKNFGREDPSSLLSAEKVARNSLNILLQNISGEVIDVRKNDR